MHSKLFKNSIIYTIGNLLPKIASFILVPIYSRYLTPSDYGITSSMSVLTMILAIVFTLAVERSINRLYYDFKTENERKDFLGTINYAIVILSSLILLLLFIFSNLVEKIFSSISFYPYYVYAILAAFLNILVTVPTMYYRVEEKAKMFVGLSLIRFAATIVFTLALVVWLKQGAEGYLKASLLAALFVFPIFLIITLRITNFTIKPDILKSSLKFSLPMIPVMVSAWVLNLSDRIFIERYLSLADVGIYSIGYSAAGFVLLFTGAFYTAYSPHFYKIANSKDKVDAKAELAKTNNIFIIATMAICFVVSLFSKEIIQILFDPRYHQAYIYIPIISLAYFFQQLNGLNHLMIYQEKKTIVVMYIIIVCATVNVLLNFLLIPLIGAYGAAITTLLALFSQFTLSYSVSRRYYFIPFNWKSILPLLTGAIIVYLLFYYLNLRLIPAMIIKTVLVAFFVIIFYVKYYHPLKKLVFS